MKTLFTWVCSAGGPLIVVPAEVAQYWRGVEGWSPSEVQRDLADESVSDYARACGIGDYLGILKVGHGEALILGDMPMQTAFIPDPEGGIFVRWMYAESEGGVRRALGSVPESAWEPTPHRIEVAREGLLVFDSACSGDTLPHPSQDVDPASWIHIELPEGTYTVDTADYEPDETTRLILHRLRGH
ncbi:Imm21 family immunity protein [Paludisphaera sp.]|uniref:Imm21 family immunity protein n=1 Tax=Paludisphaera sp. TaxID=2017432 RepID=UPI00301CE4C2